MKFFSVNPATEEVMAEFEGMDYRQASAALKESKGRFHEWKNTDIGEKLRLAEALGERLLGRKNELSRIVTDEMGKPIREAIAEIEKCALLCDYYSKSAKGFLEKEVIDTQNKKSYITFEPLGLVLGIMPWNFPFWQVMRFALPAMIAGNLVVLKHASNVPRCSLKIQEIFADSGFPEFVFRSLLVDSSAAMRLVESDHVDAVSLTGSTSAGMQVASIAGKNIKKCVLELGGSDPFIVLEDADIGKAASNAVDARMKNAGQSCIAAKRFIVVKGIESEFEDTLVRNLEKLKVGNPLEESTDIGPLAKRDILEDVERKVEDARTKGAKILFGGGRPGGRGFFYQPTLLSGIKDNMEVYREEVFGPVMPMITAEDEREAVRIANGTPYGLGASIWSSDTEKAERLARQIEAGNVFVNTIVKSDPKLPFGGVKKSGYGRELGEFGIREFVNIKTVVVNSQ
ncbi:MAG: NAD-dependent succinate-semialdehyde dehydrogenase [Candidatus Aenigmarchaeota archaeon]|nr:NAD-dependent succinate-semialdehyde dehydrogenase [Candidatus Aenigmarchaeota archaeon]